MNGLALTESEESAPPPAMKLIAFPTPVAAWKAALLLTATAHAQFVAPAEIDLFGDGLVRAVDYSDRFQFAQRSTAAPPEVAGFRDLVLFQDGRQLHGELLALTADHVVFSRPDASEPLRLPRAEVRRVIFSAVKLLPSDNEVERVSILSLAARDRAKAKPQLRVTVKLAGDDWLAGTLLSGDGRTFKLRTTAGDGVFTFARESLAWLYCDAAAAPACSFSGDALSMQSWLVPGRADALRRARARCSSRMHRGSRAPLRAARRNDSRSLSTYPPWRRKILP